MWTLKRPLIALALAAAGLAPAAHAGDVQVAFSRMAKHAAGPAAGYAGAPRFEPQRAYRGHRAGHASHTYVQKRRVWVPGRYELVSEKIWVEGATRKEWVGPVFQTRFDACGIAFRIQLAPGHWRTVRDPGYWTIREHKVWRPGHWEIVGPRY